MKKLFVLLLACLALLAFTACGEKDSEKQQTNENATQEEALKKDEDGVVEIGNEPLTLGIDENPDGEADLPSGTDASGNSNTAGKSASSENTSPSRGGASAGDGGSGSGGGSSAGDGGSGSNEVPLPPVLGGDSNKVVETPLIPLTT